MIESAKYTVTCGWPGPDIMLDIDVFLGQDKGKTFFFDISKEQAKEMVLRLQESITSLQKIEDEVEEYFKNNPPPGATLCDEEFGLQEAIDAVKKCDGEVENEKRKI